MQSTRQKTSVQQILKCKLEDIVGEHAKLMDTLETLDTHLTKLEDVVSNPNSEETKKVENWVRVAAYMDNMLDQLSVSHQALSAVGNYESMKQRTSMNNTEQVTPVAQTETEQQTLVKAPTDNSFAIASIFQAQIEGLQEQVNSIQDLQDKKLDTRVQQLETKVMVLEEAQPDGALLSRLQNIEAKHLLVEDMQFRNESSINNNSNEMTKLRIDVIGLQEKMERLESTQGTLQETLQDVQRETDNLVTLRNTLNQLHINVTERDTLSQRMNQMEEEITKLHVDLSTSTIGLFSAMQGQQGTEDTERNTAAFVAIANQLHQIVKPEDKILFGEVCCNQRGGGYDRATSVFQAPDEGLYLFSSSISTNIAGTFALAIMKNGDTMALSGTAGQKDEQTSTTVLLSLSPGDKVWVMAETHTETTGVEIGRGFSNFIGCRIK